MYTQELLNFAFCGLLQTILGNQHHVGDANIELLFTITSGNTLLDNRDDLMSGSACNKNDKLESVFIFVFLKDNEKLSIYRNS
jgi:hypothetical protein